jgi:dihydrofolate reductase
MKLTIVVAASENNVIGIDNEMPWNLPDDFRYFKNMTIGKPVIMGKNTFESLGKVLPGRLHVVISKTLENAPEGVLVFPSTEEALRYLEEQKIPEASIIGGGQIYKAMLAVTDVVLLTRVHAHIQKGNIFFPELNKNDWKLTWEEYHPKDEKHQYDFTFQKWERANDKNSA